MSKDVGQDLCSKCQRNRDKKIAAAKASKKALFRTNDEPGTPTTNKKFTDRLTEADDIDFTTKSSKVFHQNFDGAKSVRQSKLDSVPEGNELNSVMGGVEDVVL